TPLRAARATPEPGWTTLLSREPGPRRPARHATAAHAVEAGGGQGVARPRSRAFRRGGVLATAQPAVTVPGPARDVGLRLALVRSGHRRPHRTADRVDP